MAPVPNCPYAGFVARSKTVTKQRRESILISSLVMWRTARSSGELGTNTSTSDRVRFRNVFYENGISIRGAITARRRCQNFFGISICAFSLESLVAALALLSLVLTCHILANKQRYTGVGLFSDSTSALISRRIAAADSLLQRICRRRH